VKPLARNLAALAAGIVLLAPPLASRATDTRYGVLIAGRPLDIRGHSALVHRGVTYINVVRAVKAFNGLLTFTRPGVVQVGIGKRTMVFTAGSRAALLDGNTTIRLSGAPFVLEGDTYVPVAAMASLAGAAFHIDAKSRTVDFEPGGADGYPVPAATGAEGAETEDVLPSPAQALTFVPSATSDATGLHAKVDIVNKTGKPYALAFPGGTQVAFVVERNGTEVWNSSTGKPSTPATTLTFGPHETKTETVDWPAFAKRPAGRYTLRVRLLTAAPLDSAPVSLGVATPAPSPASS
jgi:hypothetical protein